MYIEPNSKIIFLKDCPLDEKYINTIFFSDRTEQYQYFYSLKKSNMHELSKLSYTRVDDGIIRVQIKCEDLYDCNYLMFKNDSFENKWFYAFITNVQYISNIVSEITFKIDVMQSWFLFDTTLKQSYVEREHSLTDNVGDNIVDEPVNLGDYTYTQMVSSGLLSHPYLWSLIIATPYIDDTGTTESSAYLGSFTGLVFRRFNYDNYQGIRNFLDGLGERVNSIVSIYLLPNAICGNGDYVSPTIIHNVITKDKPNTLGTYTNIKNKKLLTYPYTYLGVTVNKGQINEFKYEDFNSDDIEFDICGDCTPNANVMCIPKNYKNQTTSSEVYLSNDYNTTEAVVIHELPTVAWTSEAYQLWLAQNKNSINNRILLGVGGGLASYVGGVVTGNPLMTIGGVTSVVSSITTSLSTIKDAQAMPNNVIGSTSGMLLKGIFSLDFFFTQVHIKEEMAKIIDDFFNAYGYATKEIKTPNISSRPHWNYVQTVGCNIIGSCPSNVITEIKDIFDRGITFWKNGEEIGDYTLNNSPT